MKIVQLIAENIKRVKAVEITPKGNVVQITGKNGAGKSSVLDAIYYALAGGKMPKEPIRRGATSAKVSLDLGELKVTRKFTEGGTTLTVESDKGARFPSPQRMLDELIGSISFDPLAFSRMDPRAQFDTLRKVASVDVDIEALTGQNLRDYEKRTEVNKVARAARAGADAIALPEDLPAEAPNAGALLDEMQAAHKHNADLQRQKAAREAAAADAARLRERATQLEAELARVKAQATDIEERIAAAPALAEPVDVQPIREKIDAIDKVKGALVMRDRKRQLIADAEKAEAESKALTEAMEARDQAKADAIAKAKMPIPDITLGDGLVLYKGLPFDQASSAEQLRVSVAIAMAANPKLRVLRIKEGGLLDEDGMKLLEEMAAAADYQCWIETVHATGPVAVEMVDGQAKGAEATKEGESDGKLL